jgi:hypothetical protein
MKMENSPVMFSLPGLNQNTDTNNTGFASPSGDDGKKMEAYKIPPVVWMIAFLIGGYLLVRYVIED